MDHNDITCAVLLVCFHYFKETTTSLFARVCQVCRERDDFRYYCVSLKFKLQVIFDFCGFEGTEHCPFTGRLVVRWSWFGFLPSPTDRSKWVYDVPDFPRWSIGPVLTVRLPLRICLPPPAVRPHQPLVFFSGWMLPCAMLVDLSQVQTCLFPAELVPLCLDAWEQI